MFNMTSEKYIELNLNDPKSVKIAEVMANKTCKKILVFLAEENEKSATDISKQLKLPMNTVDYNLKKLLESGLIEKNLSFFWSVKGKKIPTYSVSNKKIIISTKSGIKNMLISSLFGGFLLGMGKYLFNLKSPVVDNSVFIAPTNSIPVSEVASASYKVMSDSSDLINQPVVNHLQGVGIWILLGLIFGAIVFSLYRKMKGGKNKL